MRTRLLDTVVAFLLAYGAAPRPVVAQALPSQPISVADGRLTIGGEASVAFAPTDTGFFNYTDYEHSALRLVRLAFTAALRAGEHVSILGEVRSENWSAVRPYGLYVRIRPWKHRELDIQAGRIPPTFGAFGRRSYSADNPLIGYPLAYQYLTSLRPDALPTNADDLLKMRGRGWQSAFPVGSSSDDRGMALATAFRWDTGIQVRIGREPVEASIAVTTGTLSDPLVKDDNGGKQVSGRLAFKPVVGLILGVSGARGAFLDRDALRGVPIPGGAGDYIQRALGADAEYSRDYWLVRAEAVFDQWRVPALQRPFITDPLRASGVMLEGRYKIVPGLYAAARIDHLAFSRIAGSTRTATWDAPVSRVEAGGGYYLRRNLILKLAYQRNTRDGGRVHKLNLAAGQLLFWF